MAGLTSAAIQNPTTQQNTPAPATPANPAAPTPTNAVPGMNNTATYNPAQITPSTYQINPATDTTSGQIQSIINQNDPLMQSAKANADIASNDRGMLNSSMAVGAAQKAVLDAATPIANANAQAYLNTGLTNTASVNTANTANAQSQNVAAATNSDAMNQVNKLNLGQQNQVQLQNLISGNSQLTNLSTQSGQAFQSMLNGITNIQTNPSVSGTPDPVTGLSPKETAINNLINAFNSNLSTLSNIVSTSPADIGSLNIGQYFNPNPENTPAQQAIAQNGNGPGTPPTVPPAPNYKWYWNGNAWTQVPHGLSSVNNNSNS